MQKLDEKLNVNTVGATSSRPIFEGMTLKKEKGITLIALIITMIVMLILVGVTINVALNGGLFTKADDAVKQTQLETEKEILQNIALGFLGTNGEVNFAEFETEYEGKTVEEYTIKDEGEYASATKGETIFYINKYGGISEEKPTEKEYTFTLNQLAEGGNPTLEEDSWVYFDEEYMWNNVIKEDLSKNEKYLLTTGPMDNMFDIESSDGAFGSFFKVIPEVMAGNNVSANFAVTSAIVETENGAKFAIMIRIVVNDSVEDLLDSNPQREWEITLEEFLETYGDVEFRFLDVSSVEFPE